MGPEQPIDPPDDYLEYSEEEMAEIENEDEALYDEMIDRSIDDRDEF